MQLMFPRRKQSEKRWHSRRYRQKKPRWGAAKARNRVGLYQLEL